MLLFDVLQRAVMATAGDSLSCARVVRHSFLVSCKRGLCAKTARNTA